jgi:septum site-determining protein MinD
VVDILSIKPIGVVPDDENILIGSNRGELLLGRAGEAYRDIARRLCGEEVPFMKLDGRDGFFSKVARLFGGG